MNRVLDNMRSTVRHEMTEAVMAYEDKPREQWLFDYPAQVKSLSGACLYLSLTGIVSISNLGHRLLSVPPPIMPIMHPLTLSLMLQIYSQYILPKQKNRILIISSKALQHLTSIIFRFSVVLLNSCSEKKTKNFYLSLY